MMGNVRNSAHPESRRSSIETGLKLTVIPPEDLMQEHGLLNRVLLIYDACKIHLLNKENFSKDALFNAAAIIRVFVENYHERQEENYIFPRFQKENQLTDLVKVLNYMYRPHEAREDTILFPAFRKIVSQHEYDALGEEFENNEHKLFGKGGFESMVEKVAVIEKSLGIYELGQFTP